MGVPNLQPEIKGLDLTGAPNPILIHPLLREELVKTQSEDRIKDG